MRAILVALGCGAGVLALVISYFALSDETQRLREGTSLAGSIVKVTDEKVTFQYTNENGQLVGPFRSDASAAVRAQLTAGMPVTVRKSTTDAEIEPAIEGPSEWLLVAAAFLAMLGTYFVIAPRIEQKRFDRAAGDAEAIIILTLARARTQNLWLTGLFVAMGAFPVVAVISDPDAADVGIAGIGLVLALAAVGLFAAGFSLKRALELANPAKSWIVGTLRNSPEQIVWVYEQVAQTKGVAASAYSTVVLGLADGRTYQLPLGQVGVPEFMTALRHRTPRAHFGHSPELQEAFRKDPQSLLTDPSRRVA